MDMVLGFGGKFEGVLLEWKGFLGRMGLERSVEEKKAPDERQRGRYTLFLGLQQIIIKI